MLATASAGILFSVAMAMPQLELQVALLLPAFFFLAMPIGSIYASLQLILPNQVRGQIGALQIFVTNLIGLILGPLLPGLFSDHLFRNPKMVGWSLAMTVGLGSLVATILFRACWRPYRRHFAEMHEGQVTI